MLRELWHSHFLKVAPSSGLGGQSRDGIFWHHLYHHHEGGLGWTPEEVAGSSEAAQTLGREAEGEEVHRTGPLSLFLCCFSVC